MSKARILVVDDEQQILRALRTSLRGAGYEVETADTAEGALAAAAMPLLASDSVRAIAIMTRDRSPLHRASHP